MYLCTQNYDLKRGGTFETAKAGTFHSVTAGTLIPLFTSHNSSLGNKPFKDKLKSYHEASLLMQQKEVCDMFPNGEDNPIWDKDKIVQRGKKIIKAAQEIWSIKKIEDLVPDKEEALFLKEDYRVTITRL